MSIKTAHFKGLMNYVLKSYTYVNMHVHTVSCLRRFSIVDRH